MNMLIVDYIIVIIYNKHSGLKGSYKLYNIVIYHSNNVDKYNCASGGLTQYLHVFILPESFFYLFFLANR